MRGATIAAILDLLAHHPDGMTKIEMARELGKEREALLSSINHDRSKRKRICIIGWEPTRGTGGKDQPIYALGSVDAQRPKKSTRKRRLESAARYRNRHRARLNTSAKVRRSTKSTAFGQMVEILRKKA